MKEEPKPTDQDLTCGQCGKEYDPSFSKLLYFDDFYYFLCSSCEALNRYDLKEAEKEG